VVNEEVITEQDLDRAFVPVYLQMQVLQTPEELAERAPQVRQRILQQLVEERLMLQEARNPKPVEVSKGRIGSPVPISVSEAEIDERVAEAQEKFENPEEFADALASQGIGLQELRVRYRDQITIQKLIGREINSRITVSPAEVTGYYEQHPEEFQAPPAVSVSTILIQPTQGRTLSQAKRLARELRQKLAQGADFSDLARRYSDGPNAKTGGRIGTLEQGKNLKEVDEVLFTLKPGEISPVINTSAGFHIFRVESARPARRASLEEAQGQIRDRLFQQKSAARY
jgi:parvulin-like peptidyl-prolyl isomerase